MPPARRRPPPTRPAATEAATAPRLTVEADRLSPDALEASRLLLELIHAAYPSRERDAAGTSMTGHGPDGVPLSRGAIRASIHLYQHGEASMGELAASLKMSNAWASRVVEELVRAGLVARTSDRLDRRIVHVALTAAATDFVASAYRWRGEAIERALEDLDAEERAAVRRFLARAIEELQPRMATRPADPPARQAERREAI